MNDSFAFRIPVGEWAEAAVDWLRTNLAGLFDLVTRVLGWLFDTAEVLFTAPPFWAVILVLAAISFFAKSWKLALGTVIGLAVIVGVDQWENAMITIALVLVASLIATVVAIPLGIWAARNAGVSAAIRPVLDLMQTMPAFVYLIPAILFFRVGVVPGIVATIVFAMAPGVRFTELGIRQVDREVVEAGHAFGATPGRILRQVQLPLALPTIMAGINQLIMLSLSMVVIAGMVGAPGLGQDVVRALQSVNIGLGVEAGLSVVILAMFLDRVTAALGDRAPVSRAMKVRASDD
ncbi:glycine betaine/proline transport system permease protein [Georgenia satyanarayanai]|uniref:Glycine betaine/proline transport system permease protein n=1 Tax=Georgenia satyanarayanai TaxID=860221 RepID=A0A2Y9AFU2_9MICO|nr:proline/glycine betaine ABC transporter permease [Georgenia satyanarayanai]PYF99378.1 glycine betaine/proline transport system permease protein [Georgenia satyanarayanai]SSA43190.1 glycine betaine/proline transport system permease protein [Georgenia satyanarayanai]